MLRISPATLYQWLTCRTKQQFSKYGRAWIYTGQTSKTAHVHYETETVGVRQITQVAAPNTNAFILFYFYLLIFIFAFPLRDAVSCKVGHSLMQWRGRSRILKRRGIIIALSPCCRKEHRNCLVLALAAVFCGC